MRYIVNSVQKTYVDRRLKTISTVDVKDRISTMGYLFVLEDIVELSIIAIDSTLLKAKSSVWHKSSMEKGIMPCPGIDEDARLGYSHTKAWIFGYKLHLKSTTGGEIVIPLTADVTTVHVQDNQMNVPLTSIFLVFSFTIFTLYDI